MLQSHIRSWTLSLLAAAAWIAPVHGATLAEIRQRGYMIVAVPQEPSPFATMVQNNPTGFDPALLDKFRHSVPFEVRVQALPEASLIARLKSGDVDAVAASLEITAEQQKNVDFTPPLAEATPYYLTRRGDARLKSLPDLGAKRLGIRSESENVLALTELEHQLAKAGKPLGPSTEYETDAQAYKALTDKRVDYVINDIEDLAQTVKSQPGAFAIGQPVAHKTYVAWAVAKDNADLSALLKNFVIQTRDSGELASLQQKWLGRRFAGLPDSVTVQDWWTTRSDKPSELPIPSIKDPD